MRKSTHSAIQEPVNDLDTGWSWVVMLACFASSFVVGGTNYTTGIMHVTLLDMHLGNQATTSLVGALHSSLTCLAAPLCSMVIDKFSLRTAFITSGVLYTIGFLATAFSPSIGVSIVTCGIISGFGAAFGLTSCLVATGFYFRRHRNIVQGFVVSGNGAGMFGFAPMMQTAKATYGNGGLFIILASASIHLIVFGTATIPSNLEISIHKKRETRDTERSSSPYSGLLLAYLNILTTGSIMFLSLSILLFCSGTYTVLLYLPKYCIHKGVSHMQASFVLAACGAAGIFGRIMTGAVGNCEKISEVLLLSGSMGCVAIATVLFPLFSNSYLEHIVYAVIFGIFFGSPWVLITPINISYVGVSKMAAALGTELCLGGIGGSVGPVLGGIILDRGGTYGQVFVMAGISIVIAAVFGMLSLLLARCCPSDEKTVVNKELEIECVPVSQTLLTESEHRITAAEV